MEAANSLRNQKIKAKFVERHVYAKVNTLVEFVLANPDHNPPFTWKDVNNLFYYEDWTGQRYNPQQYQQKISEYSQLIDQLEMNGELTSQQQEEWDRLSDALDDLSYSWCQRSEIIEWWLVSDWLAEKLTAHGQPTVSDGNSFYWGRTISGQAVKMDEVIHKICEDLQILAGQADEWKLQAG